jgi:uncharacterized protein (DUF1697 family)
LTEARVALLRAVNVGGRKAPMADLRAAFEELGLHDVRSVLQSGNLVFTGGDRRDAELEGRLEREVDARLGLRTDVMVRAAHELAAVIAGNPFAPMAARDPSHLVVVFLKSAPAAGAFETLQRAVKGREVVRGSGREMYVTYPDGIGESKLTAAVIESKLGVRGTSRNWNTVRKLVELTGG